MIKSIPSELFRKCNQSFKIFVTKYKYKLFNKNLNFYLIPEKCNKNKGKTKQENHDINQLNYEENIAPKKSSWKLDLLKSLLKSLNQYIFISISEKRQ